MGSENFNTFQSINMNFYKIKYRPKTLYYRLQPSIAEHADFHFLRNP